METFEIKADKHLDDLIKINPSYANVRFVHVVTNGCYSQEYKDIDWKTEYDKVNISGNTTTLERIKYNFIKILINKISKLWK